MTLSSRAWLFVFAMGALALCAREWMLSPDGRLHLYVLDVGQGESVLLVSPSGKRVVIDGGPDLSPLEHLGRILPFLNRTIDLMVLTHPNSDHLTSLPALLRRYDVRRVLLTGVAADVGRYHAMLAEIRTRNTPTALADPRRDIDLGDGVVLDILWPPPGLLGARVSRSKLNDTSVMLRVTHGTGSILITGDTEERSERALLATRQNLRADILVVPHHGSKTSSSTGFLLAVRPSLAIVSAGRGNPYGHPHPAILARYRALGIQMRMTASGTVAIVLP